MGMRVSKKLKGAPIRPKAHHSTSAYNYRCDEPQTRDLHNYSRKPDLRVDQ